MNFENIKIEDMIHGFAIALNDINEQIKKGDGGIITAYLADDETFAIYFKDKGWYTFHKSEEWFLNNFSVNHDLV